MVRSKRGRFLLASCSQIALKMGKMYNKRWNILFIALPNLTYFLEKNPHLIFVYPVAITGCFFFQCHFPLSKIGDGQFIKWLNNSDCCKEANLFNKLLLLKIELVHILLLLLDIVKNFYLNNLLGSFQITLKFVELFLSSENVLQQISTEE